MDFQFPITATATFEDGALKLDQPLNLPAGTRLRIVMAPVTDAAALDAADKQILLDILNQDRDVFQALAR